MTTPSTTATSGAGSTVLRSSARTVLLTFNGSATGVYRRSFVYGQNASLMNAPITAALTMFPLLMQSGAVSTRSSSRPAVQKTKGTKGAIEWTHVRVPRDRVERTGHHSAYVLAGARARDALNLDAAARRRCNISGAYTWVPGSSCRTRSSSRSLSAPAGLLATLSTMPTAFVIAPAARSAAEIAFARWNASVEPRARPDARQIIRVGDAGGARHSAVEDAEARLRVVERRRSGRATAALNRSSGDRDKMSAPNERQTDARDGVGAPLTTAL